MRKVHFHPGGYYHLFNHGVDEKEVFTSSRDYKRALVSLGAFNSSSNAPSNIDRFVDSPSKLKTSRYSVTINYFNYPSVHDLVADLVS